MAKTAQRQLDEFLDRYTGAIALEARAALATLRAMIPGAIEMVYDNYAGVVVGFCPNERPSDAVVSIAVRSGHISLCFLQGAPSLPDPEHLLEGTGTISRHIKLRDAAQIKTPAVRNLIGTALARARVPFDAAQPGRLIIKSISAKQRPRRPSQAAVTMVPILGTRKPMPAKKSSRAPARKKAPAAARKKSPPAASRKKSPIAAVEKSVKKVASGASKAPTAVRKVSHRVAVIGTAVAAGAEAVERVAGAIEKRIRGSRKK